MCAFEGEVEINLPRAVCSNERTVLIPVYYLEFFVAFARLEYAVKKSGFLQPRKKGKAPAASIEGLFRSNEGIATALLEKAKGQCKTLVEKPPKKMRWLSDNRCDFQEDDPAPVSTICDLRCSLLNLRNNLMHGDKNPFLGGSSGDRDEKLLRDGLRLIELIFEQWKCLKEHRIP